jgi:hypothetical protein
MIKPPAHLVEEMKIHQYFLITLNHKDIKPKHLIIATHPLHNFSVPNKEPDRDDFMDIASKYQKNPTNAFFCERLAKFYFKGYGTKANIQRAKFLYQKLHKKKCDIGTFGLLACMKKENDSLQSRFDICLERTDTNNGKILYRIGKGHVEKIYGERSNFEEGVSFLEKSISAKFRKAIPFLCIHLLKRRFGEDKKPTDLYEESEKLKDSSSYDDRVYFAVCLVLGIGISSNKRIGKFLIDLAASKSSKVGKYYHRILFHPASPSNYSIFDFSLF